MAWIEGITSSRRILKDITKIVTQANKAAGGAVDPAKNWQLIYPTPYNLSTKTGDPLTKDGTDPLLYKSASLDWDTGSPVIVYETITGATATVPATDYTVDYVNGGVIFKAARTGVITADFKYLIDKSLQTGLDKITDITDRVVLATTTTPVTPPAGSDPFGTDPDLQVTKLTQYVELMKPKFLVDPETGQLGTKYGVLGSIENNHHINIRMYDKHDFSTHLPVKEVTDVTTGLVTTVGAHVSEWSKFSWYLDFKEFLVDELDATPGTEDISKGITYAYVETSGMAGEIPIQYWISTNNDRLSMVLMGEPSLNYDNYLISFGYLGKIDSFDGSFNDTAGNFAITVGSSSIPCAAKPNLDPIVGTMNTTINVINNVPGTNTGNGMDSNTVSYKFVMRNASGFSMPSAELKSNYTKYKNSSGVSTMPADPLSNYDIKITSMPSNVTHIDVYRKENAATNWYLAQTIPAPTVFPATIVDSSTFVANTTKPVPVTNYDPSKVGVVRDRITGSVQLVRFPKSWGDNTGTGVNDIVMYKTRAGVYYQQHQTSFITPDPFMKKDAFNPSRWTSKFHLSPLYVVHGYDGYRGWLKDVVVVDDSSIIHLDELVVNKGLPNEEVYKYFKLTAPFSFMQNSGNSNYGIAIKKV